MKKLLLFFSIFTACIQSSNEPYQGKPWNEIITQFHEDMKKAPEIDIKTKIAFKAYPVMVSLQMIYQGYRIKDAYALGRCQYDTHQAFAAYKQAQADKERNEIALKFASLYSRCTAVNKQVSKNFISDTKRKAGFDDEE